MNHLIVDVETLGIHQDAVILQFTAALYNTKDKPVDVDDPQELLEKVHIFDAKLNAKIQVSQGRIVEQDTYNWWKTLPRVVQEQSLIPRKDDLDPEVACQMFEEFLVEHKYEMRKDIFWQRGSKDSDWLTSLFLGNGWIFHKMPFSWSRVRDIRTAVDVLGLSSKLNGYPDCRDELQAMIPNYKQHDARSDVLFEVLTLRLAGII